MGGVDKSCIRDDSPGRAAKYAHADCEGLKINQVRNTEDASLPNRWFYAFGRMLAYDARGLIDPLAR
jgi:hypothetical protein